MNEKYKVLDTNVILSNPKDVFSAFPPRGDYKTVLIYPIGVQKEIESFKNDRDSYTGHLTDRGFNSREAIRTYNDLTRSTKGNAFDGFNVNKNYVIKGSYDLEKRVGLSDSEILSKKDTDTRLLKICKKLTEDGKDVELITHDGALEMLANSIGIKVDYWQDFVNENWVDDIYKGWRKINLEDIDQNLVKKFNTEKSLSPSDLDLKNLMPNEYIYTSNLDEIIYNNKKKPQEIFLNQAHAIIGKYCATQDKIVPLWHYQNRFMNGNGSKKGIFARSPRQLFFMDMLRNPDVDRVFALGPAGSGKTYLGIDSAMELVFLAGKSLINKEMKKKGFKNGYEQVTLTRPVRHHTGEEQLGFEPGNITEKMQSWLGPFQDQFKQLIETYDIDEPTFEGFWENNIINLQRLAVLRGRNLEGLWILDEAQNIQRETFKSIMTRGAEGLKMILCGDENQADLNNIHPRNIPLLYQNELWKNEPNSATVYFLEKDVVRSQAVRRYLELERKFKERQKR